MNKGLLFSCLFIITFTAQATPISLEYKGFYQRLKQMNKQNYSLIDIAFSVPKNNGCIIESGYISTEKSRYPLSISKDQRLLIPFDEQLKTDRALINLQMKNDVTRCNVAMQIRAKIPKKNYQRAELQELSAQMNKLLKQMQGFPMKYFADDIAGISMVFDKDAEVSIDGRRQRVDGTYRLSMAQISQLNQLKLSEIPSVISPWVN